MKSAPKRGEGVQADKKRAPRLEPRSPKAKSVSSYSTHSAPNAETQGQPRATRRSPPHILIPARKRRHQISALLWYRHGGPCRTDDAIVYFEAIAVQLAICCLPVALDHGVSEWVARNTPDLAAVDIAEVMDRVRTHQRVSYRSEDLGLHLQVTAAEKALLGLTHLGAIGVTVQQIEDQRRARNRERMRAKRFASGETKTPREQSIARTVERRNGESKTALYERVKRERQATSA